MNDAEPDQARLEEEGKALETQKEKLRGIQKVNKHIQFYVCTCVCPAGCMRTLRADRPQIFIEHNISQLIAAGGRGRDA